MDGNLAQLAVPAWELALRCAVIYLGLLIGLRLFGKREVGQITLFDLVTVLLVANAVQPAMTGPDSSLVGGLIIIATLLLLNRAMGWARLHSPLFRQLLQSHPTVIAQEGHWLPNAMKREGLAEDEAEMALREHGLSSVKEAKLAVLELDGTISIVPTDSRTIRTRRRLRLLRPRQ
ncbi:MAG TPA: YetF domain-containing protein [Chloroflexota bacterium]|nr:YetF domain-containing protein [Chloroflexota bacterium]